jgi:hypothetical protein
VVDRKIIKLFELRISNTVGFVSGVRHDAPLQDPSFVPKCPASGSPLWGEVKVRRNGTLFMDVESNTRQGGIATTPRNLWQPEFTGQPLPTPLDHQRPQTMGPSAHQSGTDSSHLTPPADDPNNPLIRAAAAARRRQQARKKASERKRDDDIRYPLISAAAAARRRQQARKKASERKRDEDSRMPHEKPQFIQRYGISWDVVKAAERALMRKIPGVHDIDSAYRHALQEKRARLQRQLDDFCAGFNGLHLGDAAHEALKSEIKQLDDLCAGLGSLDVGNTADKRRF